MNRPIDVLIVTATQLETREFLKHIAEYSEDFGETNVYFRFMIGETQCCLVWSGMSSRTPDGSFLTVSDAINELDPSAVIMVGIAFGADPNKQQIGDILISAQVTDYGYRRFGTNKKDYSPKVINRGDTIPASPKLLQRMRAYALRWDSSRIFLGRLLTGEELIDNKIRLNELLSENPEAIGGEMEGAGLYASAYRANTDWIIVKAISDWADGSKSEDKQVRQSHAVQNVIKFVLGAVESGGFAASIKNRNALSPPLSRRKEYELELSLNKGLYALTYGNRVDVDNSVSLFQVEIMNIGSRDTYLKNIAIQATVDGTVQYFHVFNFGDPYLEKINPPKEKPIPPGAGVTYHIPFESLRQIQSRGEVVVPTHVIVTDQIGNSYSVEINEEYQNRIMY